MQCSRKMKGGIGLSDKKALLIATIILLLSVASIRRFANTPFKKKAQLNLG